MVDSPTAHSPANLPFVTSKDHEQIQAPNNGISLWKRVKPGEAGKPRVKGHVDLSQYQNDNVALEKTLNWGDDNEPSQRKLKVSVPTEHANLELTLEDDGGQPQVFKLPSFPKEAGIPKTLDLEFYKKEGDSKWHVKLEQKNEITRAAKILLNDKTGINKNKTEKHGSALHFDGYMKAFKALNFKDDNQLADVAKLKEKARPEEPNAKDPINDINGLERSPSPDAANNGAHNSGTHNNGRAHLAVNVSVDQEDQKYLIDLASPAPSPNAHRKDEDDEDESHKDVQITPNDKKSDGEDTNASESETGKPLTNDEIISLYSKGPEPIKGPELANLLANNSFSESQEQPHLNSDPFAHLVDLKQALSNIEKQAKRQQNRTHEKNDRESSPINGDTASANDDEDYYSFSDEDSASNASSKKASLEGFDPLAASVDALNAQVSQLTPRKSSKDNSVSPDNFNAPKRDIDAQADDGKKKSTETNDASTSSTEEKPPALNKTLEPNTVDTDYGSDGDPLLGTLISFRQASETDLDNAHTNQFEAETPSEKSSDRDSIQENVSRTHHSNDDSNNNSSSATPTPKQSHEDDTLTRNSHYSGNDHASLVSRNNTNLNELETDLGQDHFDTHRSEDDDSTQSGRVNPDQQPLPTSIPSVTNNSVKPTLGSNDNEQVSISNLGYPEFDDLSSSERILPSDDEVSVNHEGDRESSNNSLSSNMETSHIRNNSDKKIDTPQAPITSPTNQQAANSESKKSTVPEKASGLPLLDDLDRSKKPKRSKPIKPATPKKVLENLLKDLNSEQQAILKKAYEYGQDKWSSCKTPTAYPDIHGSDFDKSVLIPALRTMHAKLRSDPTPITEKQWLNNVFDNLLWQNFKTLRNSFDAKSVRTRPISTEVQQLLEGLSPKEKSEILRAQEYAMDRWNSYANYTTSRPPTMPEKSSASLTEEEKQKEIDNMKALEALDIRPNAFAGITENDFIDLVLTPSLSVMRENLKAGKELSKGDLNRALNQNYRDWLPLIKATNPTAWSPE